MPPANLLAQLTPATRPNFVNGLLLTAEDLKAEQDYHRGQRWLHNRLLHGAGTVAGLDVTVSGGSARISPGVALDCLGREIIVAKPTLLALPAKGTRWYLCAAYAERGLEPLPLPPDPSPFGVSLTFRLTEETFALSWCDAPVRHSRLGSGWQACGDDHGVPLARLVRTRGRWQRDTTYRRPALL